MNRISIINEIEENYDVNSILSNQVPIWQYIRNLIYGQPDCSKNLTRQVKDFYSLVRNHNWGNYQSCKKFKYLLFTDSNEEIMHDNQKIDKTSQNIIELVGDDLMVVVNPNGKTHNKSIECADYYMSSSFFHYKRWRNGLTSTQNIDGLKDLEKILNNNNINLDVDYFNRLFFTYVNIFSDWLIKTEPKSVFINCYYSLFHQALIYACKKQKIKTIEIQHGLISNSHSQYSPKKFIGKHTMPDYLLCYNDYVKTLTNKNYMDPQNIIPIGHYYIEKKLNEKFNPAQLHTSPYSRVVAVSAQNDLEQELIEEIEAIALMKLDTLFIIKTRDNKSITSPAKNIKINTTEDMYSLIKCADLHISCYSTVALEASMMGTPTILINIKNMSKLYYGAIIKEFENITICDSSNEVLNLMDNWAPSNINNKPYALNNRQNIKQFLDNYIN